MPTMQSVTDEALSRLRHVIEANESIDWRAFSFDESSLLQTLQWQEHEGEQDDLIPLLKAYQRLLHILPPSEDRRALSLLQAGLHSAIQIANIRQDQFARQWAALFPGEDALGEAVHRSAISRRSTLLLHHIDSIQSNEPHYRAARFR
jgi:hypothetical protein